MADELDEIMPDLELEGGASEELEIVIADEQPDGEEETGGGVHLEQEDETPALASDDEGEELTAEDKNYSKKVQDRILRERRLRKRQVQSAREATEAAESQVQAERARANALEVGIVEARLAANTIWASGLEKEVVSLKAALTAAIEGGNTEDQVRLQSQLNEAETNLKDAKSNKVRLEEQKKAPQRASPTVENKAATAWLSANSWFNDQEFAGEANLARSEDAKLGNSGKFSKNSPEYFRELDRRIHEKLPKLRSEVKAAGLRMSYEPKTPPKASGRPSPALPARERSAGAQVPLQSRSKVTLTKTDLANMASFKMDPKNPKDLQQWAREKIAAQQGE